MTYQSTPRLYELRRLIEPWASKRARFALATPGTTMTRSCLPSHPPALWRDRERRGRLHPLSTSRLRRPRDDTERIRRVGRLLYGEQWLTPLADTLIINPRATADALQSIAGRNA